MFSPSQQFLYNSIEDHKGGVMKNSIWVNGIPDKVKIPEKYMKTENKSVSLQDAHTKYVTLAGRFIRHLPYKTSSMPTGSITVFFVEEITAPRESARP
jgi:hypothetical protein